MKSSRVGPSFRAALNLDWDEDAPLEDGGVLAVARQRTAENEGLALASLEREAIVKKNESNEVSSEQDDSDRSSAVIWPCL